MSSAAALLSHVRGASRPRNAIIHLMPNGESSQLFVVDGSQLYAVSHSVAERLRRAADSDDEASLADMLKSLGVDTAAAPDQPRAPDLAPYALSLAVAQKCNLACGYCYAQQGAFGGAARNMPLETALRSVDLLLDAKVPGSRVNLAFLGGEPLQNRVVLRATTEYASRLAVERGIEMGFSITTNGTLLKASDAEFFERHGFAVTVSLDGARAEHDRLRPLKNGRGSFDLILRNVAPLLEGQRRSQISARVTVTPLNLTLPDVLDRFIGLGFHSVGFSPLLNASNGQGEMSERDLETMLENMIACGLRFEESLLRGVRYPFLNMTNALQELHRGSHRSYPCGAGVNYFGVSADGELSACHRFVGDQEGRFGTLGTGIDATIQDAWLRQRRVERQVPCATCWARHLCGGGCHHEVLARGRHACDYIRGWLHYTIQAYGRLSALVPQWLTGDEARSE
jgi:uncharacterized protein